MDFIKKEAILPVPFNLFPMPYSIAKMVKKFWNFVLRRQEAYASDDIEMPRIQKNGGANGAVEVTKQVQFIFVHFISIFDLIF